MSLAHICGRRSWYPTEIGTGLMGGTCWISRDLAHNFVFYTELSFYAHHLKSAFYVSLGITSVGI